MTKKALIEKIDALQSMELQIKEMTEIAEALKDEIKAELTRKKVDEYEVGKYIVRWTPVLSNRFDSTAFKKAHARLYKDFTKQISSRKFTISK